MNATLEQKHLFNVWFNDIFFSLLSDGYASINSFIVIFNILVFKIFQKYFTMPLCEKK